MKRGQDMIGVLLFLVAAVQMVIPHALAGNVREFKLPKLGEENEHKCHVRGRWTGMIFKYEMICYQCNDDLKSIIIYSGGTPVDAAYVNTCKQLAVEGSVTALPTTMYTHKIEYRMTSKKCVSVNYDMPNNGPQLKRIETTCPSFSLRHLPENRVFYYSAWKPVQLPWTTGVVREIYSTIYDTTNCKLIRKWSSIVDTIEMVCYDCETTDFVVKIYNGGDEIATATVGTCRSINVEHSIDILKPSKTSPTTVGIQFKRYTDQCVYKTYTKRGEKQEIITKDGCVYQRERVRKYISGYRNGWKIVSESRAV